MGHDTGGWKKTAVKTVAVRETRHFAILAAIAVALAALWWANTASAALPKNSAITPQTLTQACSDKISNLFLAGTFVMPSTGEQMSLWIGKPKNSKQEVRGFIGKHLGSQCEAQCSVARFERFQKDLKPALMELECEGLSLKSMRMPLHVQWSRNGDGFDTTIRMGNSIYGVERTPIQLEVNRYSVAVASQK